MFRVLGPSVGMLFVLALWAFALFDVIATDEILVRNLPKGMWLLLVIFVPLMGSIAWFILGRPLYAGWQPGGQSSPPPRSRYVAPEDRNDFSARAAPPPTPSPPPTPGPSVDDLRRWEQELAQREDELRRREGGDPASG